jgi:tetratricopeptide (TPR) repeat protein
MRMSVWMRALMIAAVAPSIALGPGIAHAQPKGGKTASAPTADASAKKATALFGKALDLYNAKKYALALEQFKLSYAEVPSPNSHLYIARCMGRLGDMHTAYNEFDKVIAESAERGKTEDKYLRTGETARLERDELLSKVALVTVNVAHPGPTTTVRLGDAEIAREQWDKPFAIPPGAVEAKISAGDRVIASQSATIAAGQSHTLVLDAAAAPVVAIGTDPEGQPTTKSSKSALRPAGIIVGSVGVAGFVLFATYSSLEKECGTGPCPTSRADDISSGKTQQTLANVGLVVGAVGVAAGATLLVLSLGKGKSAPAPTTGLIVGPGYVGVNGTF